MKQNARSEAQSEETGRSWKAEHQYRPGPANQGSQHKSNQPRGSSQVPCPSFPWSFRKTKENPQKLRNTPSTAGNSMMFFESAKTDPVQFKWGLGKRRLKDKFAF